MKVTTDTPDLLIVEDRPILLGLMLVLFIFVFVWIGLHLAFSGEPFGPLFALLFTLFGGGAGVAAFVVFVRRVQVVFDRPEGYVEIRRRNALGGGRVRHALAEIDRAILEKTRSSGSTTWRVALVIEAGQSVGHHPLTFVYSNGSGHRRVADAINRWLAAARAEG